MLPQNIVEMLFAGFSKLKNPVPPWTIIWHAEAMLLSNVVFQICEANIAPFSSTFLMLFLYKWKFYIKKEMENSQERIINMR